MICDHHLRSTAGGPLQEPDMDYPPRRNREKAREEMAPQQPRREDLTTRLMPKAGNFHFFPPSLSHRVDVNRSQEQRLSLAFNLGPMAMD